MRLLLSIDLEVEALRGLNKNEWNCPSNEIFDRSEYSCGFVSPLSTCFCI